MLLKFSVNGVPVEREVPADLPLAHLLRYDLGLTGTKVGCEEGRCGTCTVLVNGRAVRSCVYPARKLPDAQVLTIEGLAEGDRLHPLQRAFIRHGALQCGFCTPGMLMAAKALLDRRPDPSEEEIKRALKGNLCRCTGYDSIITAIKDVAQDSSLPIYQSTDCHSQIGRPRPPIDAVAKVTGAARYADDYSFPDMLHGATLRAGRPHARIERIDVSRARALAGVWAVLTHQDVPGAKRHGLFVQDWPVLCQDKVRYVGDAVAVVAAETPEIAQRALDLIEVEYESLPVVADGVSARRPEAPLVHQDWPTGNLFKHIEVRRGDVAAGFAQAEVVVERTFHTPTVEHLFMEPECSLARLTEDGRIQVYVGSQIPYADRRQIAASLDLPEDRVRVVGTLIGGAFGGKEDVMGQIHAALLAQATGRPVKVLYSRRESLLVHPKRHATVIRVKLGARRDGRLVAFEAELVGDTGAYASLGEKVMTRATTHASGPYDVPNVQVDCYAMYTNNPPAGAFRGFGVPQSCFAVESAMDELAQKLALDPWALRRLNALRVGSTTCTGQVLRESVGLVQCLDWVRQRVAEQGSQLLQTDSPDKKRAWGFALAYKNTGLGGGAPDKAEAELEMYADGRAQVRVSSAELGQGLPGVLATLVAKELGLPFDRVSVLLSDTDLTPDGGPTTASRQTFVSGNAARHAAQAMRERLAAVVGGRWNVAPAELIFRGGFIEAGERAVDVGQAAQWAQAEGRPPRLSYQYWAPETQPLGQGGDMHVGFGFAAQAALVEVDTRAGQVRVLKVIAAHDVGRALNPLALDGQIKGGIVMGLGQALSEEFVVEAGVPRTDRLARYKIPTAQDIPEIVSHLVEEPLSTGPYGAKGMGELPSIPIIPAITNGIYNAVGLRLTRLPVGELSAQALEQAVEES